MASAFVGANKRNVMFTVIGARTKKELVNEMNKMKAKECHMVEKVGVSYEAIVSLSDSQAKEYQKQIEEQERKNQEERMKRLKQNGHIEDESEEDKETEE